MRYGLIIIALCMMGLMTAPFVSSAENLVAPLHKRTTDEQIHADKKIFDALEKRLSQINQAGVPIDSYLFAKASSWLDFAFNEYTDNDKTGIVEEALREAVYLIRLMEDKALVIATGTPIGKESKEIRKDLWDRVEILKQEPGFRCGGGKVARLEVMLVWAGHEEKELGFRHAMPYIKQAERLGQEASETISSCLPPVPPALVDVAPPPIPVVPVPPPVPILVPLLPPTLIVPELPPAPAEKVKKLEVLADRVHFAKNTDKIGPKTLAVLNQIASVLREFPSILVRLYGHADSVGAPQYNMALSKRRAEAVKAYLVAAGVAEDRLTSEGFGQLRPTVIQKSKKDSAKNRRVEFIFESGVIQTTGQDGDIEIEQEKQKIKGREPR